MATKRLAKELGLLRQRSTSGSKKQLVSNQIFSYIIVIDFESTCWREKNNYGQEIVEFPAVLLNTSTGHVEEEFHTYVQPQEHPILSDFCTELTGITQPQVEAGVPLQICLSRFSRWLQDLQRQKGLVFHRPQNTVQSTDPQKLCTFLTWSDWDLGVCLQYECKRKQINKPSVFNSWIDLRSTYRMFYNRKPKGLNGALQDLGIQFEGREHSGLDDSRNTAQLTARMMRDGCVMKVTRSLDRIPVICTKAPAKTKKPITEEHDQRASTINPSTSLSFHKSNNNTQNVNRNSMRECQSLVSPKTLLNGTVNLQEACKSVTNLPNLSSFTVNSISSPRHNNIAPNIIDTVHENMEEGASEEILVETEERCGSYDDVVLDIFENGIFEETVFSITNSATRGEATTMGCNRSNNSEPQVLVHNTPSFCKKFPKQSALYTENVTENHYISDLGRSEETINSADTDNRQTIPQSKTMRCSNSIIMESKSTNSGLEMRFAVPYPVSKPQSNFSARKQTQTSSLLLNKSEISPTNPSNPHVLVPNTPSFPKTIPKRTNSFTIYTENEDPSTSHTSTSIQYPVSKPKTNFSSRKLPQMSSLQLNKSEIGPPFKPQVFIPNTKCKNFFTIYTDNEHPSTSHYLTFNSREVLANLSNNKFLNGTSRITSLQSKIPIYSNPENVHNILDLGRSEETMNSRFAVPYPVSKPNANLSAQKQPQTSCLLLNKSEIGPTNPSKPQILVPGTAKTIPKRNPSFTDTEGPSTSHNSTFNSREVLANLSNNTSLNGTLVGMSRITSPLCLCGRRAKRQTVSNGGPNQGRGFFSCPVRRSGTLGRVQKGCEFFKWESAVMRDSFKGASVSMCQVNTSGQQQKGLRKSF